MLISICTYLYLLLLLIHSSGFCCFASPIAIQLYPLILVDHTPLKCQKKVKIVKIQYNIKNTTRHRGKPTPLIYCFRSLDKQSCGTQFLVFFLKLFREMNSFIFFQNDFPSFGALIGSAFRRMNHCVQGRYPANQLFS